MSLDNAQVVVLGGSSGIGLATAWGALAEGAKVTISGRSAERLEQAARELGEGDSVTTVVAVSFSVPWAIHGPVPRPSLALVTPKQLPIMLFASVASVHRHSHSYRAWRD